uniref:Protein kinase domain-containing protein n=1 Tax=Picea sitchensis TaxID=3332 RepID=D5AEB1_PICSI|nr:unknown [Picea sitchensis]
MVEEETANMSTAAAGDRQKPDEKTATISGKGGNYSVVEAKDYPILIDFEKICLSERDGDLKVEDPDYMKKRLLEWVHAVAAYVRFLHASENIT